MTQLVAPNCRRCALAGTRQLVVQPELPSGMRVLFVGRDPGAVEDRTGRPLHPDAPAGGLLRRLIADVGIPAEWCGFDNVVHCHTVKNAGPKKEEVLACSSWVHVVKRGIPAGCVVVLLGIEATEAWFNPVGYNPKKPQFKVGETFQIDGTTYCVPHPSAALRNGVQRRELRRRLKLIASELGIDRPEPPFTVAGVPTSATTIAVDVETSMVDGHLLGVGMAWREGEEIKACWFPPSGIRLLRDCISATERVIMHNGKFDVRVLAENGVEMGVLVDDTYLMAHVLRRDQFVGGLGLKELALVDLGLAWDTLVELGPPEELAEEELAHYCLCDCVATLLLWERYNGEMV